MFHQKDRCLLSQAIKKAGHLLGSRRAKPRHGFIHHKGLGRECQGQRHLQLAAFTMAEVGAAFGPGIRQAPTNSNIKGTSSYVSTF